MDSSNHPTFMVRVSLRIWTHEESVVQSYHDDIEMDIDWKEEDRPSYTELYKELRLPFVPFLGLSLSGNWIVTRPFIGIE